MRGSGPGRAVRRAPAQAAAVPGVPPRLAPVAEALGVTRVARLTGLDRLGIEVAAAVRPGGHVLQVSTGKGATFAAAAAGALAEAAELWAAERPLTVADGTAAAQRERFGAAAVIGPEALAPDEASPAWEGIRLAWRTADDLLRGKPCLVPAHAVHCPPAGTTPLGPAVVPWTSNGMGAHRSRDAALLHALLEACERDQLERAAPEGFTPPVLRERLLAPGSLAAAAPRAAALAGRLAARGLRVHLLDLGLPARPPGRGGLGLPVAGAVLVEEGGPVPIAAGYACRPGRDAALCAALLEAAQSRLTEIHGAREDVLHADRHEALPLARALARARPSRRAAALPDLAPGSPRAAVALVLRRLEAAGHRRVAAAWLAGPPGLQVVKVLAPGLLRSGLLG